MPKTKRTHLTDKTFSKVKELANLGLTNSQLMQISGYSTATVCRIKQASDFENYQQRRSIEATRQRAKGTLPATQEVQPINFKEKTVAPTTDNEIIKDLFKIVQDQTSVINRMDQSLTWLAEHAVIQSVNTKRRFF